MGSNGIGRSALVGALCVAAAAAQVADSDRDGDGLSDFQEVHKYGTDPGKADSDGDSVPDGDWLERREYQYWVRTIVQVMRPVTPEYLNDDFQDARVLDATADYVELEVIHYPFAAAVPAIAPDPRWRQTAAALPQWTAPGPTADWTPALRAQLLAALERDGIDAGRLDDKTLVEAAARWLCKHAQYRDGFSTFVVAFDVQGQPFVPDDLRAGAEQSARELGTALQEQWQREISARPAAATKVAVVADATTSEAARRAIVAEDDYYLRGQRRLRADGEASHHGGFAKVVDRRAACSSTACAAAAVRRRST